MNSADDYLTERLLSHPAKNNFERLTIMSKKPALLDDQKNNIQRIMSAYNKAINNGPPDNWTRDSDDLWYGIESNGLNELAEVLKSNSPELVHEVISGFGSTFTWFGGVSSSIDGFNRNLSKSHVALTYFDHLVSLAEACGILNVENPESGPWGEALDHDINNLVEKLNKYFGFVVVPPMEIFHVDGLHTNAGLLHYRHINALSIVLNLRKLCIENNKVCEIGGGSGFTAFYSGKLGFKHSIFDLPITCVLSSYFLLNTFDPSQIELFGEKNKNSIIKVFPYWQLDNVKDKKYSLAINHDGIPEFPKNLIEMYAKTIQRKSSYFLSVNHETFANKTIKDFFNCNSGYKNVYRYRNWCRAGYVDELFECK